MTLGSTLSSEFDLQIATSGVMGLSLAARNPPDLILLDVMMPEMDGFETCKRLKADPKLKNIPVIFVTSLDDPLSETRGLDLGAADYITKPINVDIARRRIRNILEYKRAHEMLRKLSIAVEQSPASVVITDLDACIEYVNPRFSEVTGYSNAEAIGQNPRILQSGLTGREIYQELWEKLARGEPWHGELVNKRKNGELYWEETHVAPVKNVNGEVTHYVAVKTDITQRKQAEANLVSSELHLQTVVDNEPECVKIVDAQGLLQQMNPSGLTMIEADSLAQVAGRPVIDLIAPEYRVAFSDLHKRVLDGESVKMEFEMVGLKGGRRWLETHAVPMEDHGEKVHLAVTRDITERKRTEKAITYATLRVSCNRLPISFTSRMPIVALLAAKPKLATPIGRTWLENMIGIFFLPIQQRSMRKRSYPSFPKASLCLTKLIGSTTKMDSKVMYKPTNGLWLTKMVQLLGYLVSAETSPKPSAPKQNLINIGIILKSW
jgi:PAS domain S-box-containing protein